MRIERFRAAGWRNLQPVELTFAPDATLHVLFGQNGQGKTNVIEALYFLSAFRSFRTTQAGDLVGETAAEAQVSTEIRTRETTRLIAARLVRGAADAGGAAGNVGRTISVDGKPVRRLSAAFGLMSVVLFVPEDLSLARAAPAARRRFLDMATAGITPAYLGESATFQRILRGRNALLRSGRADGATAWLETVDEQLARAGARVVARRRAFVREMAPRAEGFFRALHADLAVELLYDADPAVVAATSEGEVAGVLLAGLAARRPVDLRRRHTTFGPQTDDLGILLAGRPAREHASQGQLRSLILALKLAELMLLGAARGEAGVLLLDDVPSELDLERRRFLFDTLTALGCQTILSVADRGVVPAVSARADIEVKAGRLEPVPGGQHFSLLGGS